MVRSSYKASKKPSKAALTAVRKEIKRSMRKHSELHRNHWYIAATVNSFGEGSSYFVLPNDNSASPTSFTLNGTIQGVDVNQRVGNQIKEVGLRIKGLISQNVSTLSHAIGCVRIIVLRDHDNKAAPPVTSDFLEYPGSAGDGHAMGSLVKWANRKRFSFLFDQTIPLNPQSSGATSAQIVAALDINLPLSKTLTMSLNTRDAGSINDGGIYAYFLYTNANANPTGADLPTFHGAVAFTFIDV